MFVDEFILIFFLMPLAALNFIRRKIISIQFIDLYSAMLKKKPYKQTIEFTFSVIYNNSQ